MSETENNELTAEKQSKEPRSNQKLKLLYLAKILLNNTDANHDITLDEILNRLHAYARMANMDGCVLLSQPICDFLHTLSYGVKRVRNVYV